MDWSSNLSMNTLAMSGVGERDAIAMSTPFSLRAYMMPLACRKRLGESLFDRHSLSNQKPVNQTKKRHLIADHQIDDFSPAKLDWELGSGRERGGGRGRTSRRATGCSQGRKRRGGGAPGRGPGSAVPPPLPARRPSLLSSPCCGDGLSPAGGAARGDGAPDLDGWTWTWTVRQGKSATKKTNEPSSSSA